MGFMHNVNLTINTIVSTNHILQTIIAVSKAQFCVYGWSLVTFNRSNLNACVCSDIYICIYIYIYYVNIYIYIYMSRYVIL